MLLGAANASSMLTSLGSDFINQYRIVIQPAQVRHCARQHIKKTVVIIKDHNRFRIQPRLCRYVGIPNQSGSRWSQSIQLRVRRTSDAHSRQIFSVTDAYKWFKEYMTIANTAGDSESTRFHAHVKHFERKSEQVFLRRKCAIQHHMHRFDFLPYFSQRQVR